MITLGIIILLLPLISHIIGKSKIFKLKKEKDNTDFTYYFFKGKKYIPAYTGVCFYTLKHHFTLFTIQTGKNGYDRCITICNISFILGT